MMVRWDLVDVSSSHQIYEPLVIVAEKSFYLPDIMLQIRISLHR